MNPQTGKLLQSGSYVRRAQNLSAIEGIMNEHEVRLEKVSVAMFTKASWTDVSE